MIVVDELPERKIDDETPQQCGFCGEKADTTNVLFGRDKDGYFICGSCVIKFSMHMTQMGEAGCWDYRKRH